VSGFDPAVAAFFAGGKTTAGLDSGVDTVFDFSLYSALRNVILHGAPATLLEHVLQQDWLFPHPDWLVTFLGNHDTRRFMGEAGATPEKLNLAFALLLTMRGIPQIYAGDEIGMPGGDDPDNRRDFPGGFPGDSRSVFTAEGRATDEQKVYVQVRNLLHLRQQHPALRRGRYVHIFSDEHTLVYVRDFRESQVDKATQHRERLLMVMNNAGESRTVEIQTRDTLLADTKTLSRVMADRDAAVSPGPKLKVELPAKSLSIYLVE